MSNDTIDKDAVPKKVTKSLWVLCAGSILLELCIHKHPHFGFDSLFGFYGLMGFLACVLLIGIAKLLGLVLKVGDDYYDDE